MHYGWEKVPPKHIIAHLMYVTMQEKAASAKLELTQTGYLKPKCNSDLSIDVDESFIFTHKYFKGYKV